MSRYDFNEGEVTPRTLSRPPSNRNTPRRGRRKQSYGEPDVVDPVRIHFDRQETTSNNRFNMYLNYSGQPSREPVSSPSRRTQDKKPTISMATPEDIELTTSDNVVLHTPHFPQIVRQPSDKPIKPHIDRSYRSSSYYQSSTYQSSSSCPRKVILSLFGILNFIMIILAFVSLFDAWTQSIMIDQGMSGIVKWREVTTYFYFLTEYENMETHQLKQYMSLVGDDFRRQCRQSGAQSGAFIGLGLTCQLIALGLTIYHLLLPNIDLWDKRTRSIFLSLLVLGFFTVFFVTLGCGCWWFGCHYNVITHAEEIAWSSTVAEVYTTIELGTGFGLSFLNCWLGIIGTALLASFYRRG